MVYDIEWFKENVMSSMHDYTFNFRTYSEGDFGSLNQIEFNSNEKGGNVDFWGLGYVGIFLWDYQKEEEIMNVLLDPNQQKEQAFKELQNYLRVS